MYCIDVSQQCFYEHSAETSSQFILDFKAGDLDTYVKYELPFPKVGLLLHDMYCQSNSSVMSVNDPCRKRRRRARAKWWRAVRTLSSSTPWSCRSNEARASSNASLSRRRSRSKCSTDGENISNLPIIIWIRRRDKLYMYCTCSNVRIYLQRVFEGLQVAWNCQCEAAAAWEPVCRARKSRCESFVCRDSTSLLTASLYM